MGITWLHRGGKPINTKQGDQGKDQRGDNSDRQVQTPRKYDAANCSHQDDNANHQRDDQYCIHSDLIVKATVNHAEAQHRFHRAFQTAAHGGTDADEEDVAMRL